MRRGSVSDSSIVDHLVNPLTFLLKQAGVWLVLMGVLRLILKPSHKPEQTGDGNLPAAGAEAAMSPNQRRLAHLVIIGPIVGFLLASAITGASPEKYVGAGRCGHSSRCGCWR